MNARNSFACLLLATAALAWQPDRAAADDASIALTGATLMVGDGSPAIANSTIVIAGERIVCAGSAADCTVPDGARVIDATGKWITPGVIDAHVHFAQTAWVDGRPDVMDLRDIHPYNRLEANLKNNPGRFYRAYLCSGVTGVFDVGGFPWSWDRRAGAEHNPNAPHIAAAGPLVTHAPRQQMALPGELQFVMLADEDGGREAVRYMKAFGSDAVKVWFLRPQDGQQDEIDARVRAVGAEAKALGIPLIVHATGLREAKVALESGAHLLVHSVDDTIVDDEFIALAKQAGTVYNPTLTVVDGYNRMFASLRDGTPPPIDDPNHCVDADTLAKIASTPGLKDHPAGKAVLARDNSGAEERIAAREKNLNENLRRVHAAGITVAMGTDAGNPLTLHGPSVYGEMEAMQAAGLTPSQVLTSATRNSAIAMGRLDDLGTLEAGKFADLLILGADPLADIANMRKLERVMRGGHLHDVGDLRAQ